MNFFFRKKDQARPKQPPRDCYSIELSGRDYQQMTESKAALKLWLPESVEQKIDQMCNFVNTSASDLIRQILFIHLYGRYDLFGLMERQIGTFNLGQPPMFSQTADNLHQPAIVEKSNADVKVWLPVRMKEDLDKLALQNKMSMSHYAREVITTHLFGHVPSVDQEHFAAATLHE